MDSLLDILIRQAQELLEKHGEFYPFGAAVSREGDINLSSAYSGSERPESQALIDLIYEGFGEARSQGEIRAVGVCFDVRLSGRDKGDAIQVALEHSGADPVNVFVPYKKGRRGPEYGELFATRGERHVFT
jgi:hypothetical protein